MTCLVTHRNVHFGCVFRALPAVMELLVMLSIFCGLPVGFGAIWALLFFITLYMCFLALSQRRRFRLCFQRLCGGAKRGRPVGSTNCTDSTPSRQSKRQRTGPSSYVSPGANTDRKNAQNLSRKHVLAVKAKKRRPRGHGATRKSRKGQSKDAKRAKHAAAARNARSEHARQMRNAIADVVLDTLSQQQQKRLALVAFYTLLSTGSYTRGAAADLAALIHGVYRETVLLWARGLEAAMVWEGPSCGQDDADVAEALQSCEAFWASLRGKHAKQLWLLADPDKQERAKIWIRQHLKVKGEGNLKVTDFALYLNDDLLADDVEARGKRLCDSTARVYLHKLGFETGAVRKGIDLTVHERADVVEQRRAYLAAIDKELSMAHQPGGKPVVLVYHDETVFQSFDAEGTQWFESGSVPTEKKARNRGKGLMRSEFLTKEKGLLFSASLELDFGRDGYFNSSLFLAQVRSNHTLGCVRVRVWWLCRFKRQLQRHKNNFPATVLCLSSTIQQFIAPEQLMPWLLVHSMPTNSGVPSRKCAQVGTETGRAPGMSRAC
jgi:hypothetical protein